VTQLESALGGDDEQIEIDLKAVPVEVDRIVVVLYLNEGTLQRRTLGRLKACVIRVLNLSDNSELVRSEDFAPMLSDETALALGEMYRHDGGWKFRVIGGGYLNGMLGIAADYGLAL
jgi:tellurium resistance protein TerD